MEGLFVTSVCLFISMFPDCLASPLSQKPKESFGTLPTVPPLPSIMTSTDGVPDLTIPTITLGYFNKMDFMENDPRTTNTPHTTNTPRIPPKTTFSSKLKSKVSGSETTSTTFGPYPTIRTSTDGIPSTDGVPIITMHPYSKVNGKAAKFPRTLPTVPPLPSIMTSTDGVPDLTIPTITLGYFNKMENMEKDSRTTNTPHTTNTPTKSTTHTSTSTNSPTPSTTNTTKTTNNTHMISKNAEKISKTPRDEAERSFFGLSFLGGMVLSLLIVCFIGSIYMTYKFKHVLCTCRRYEQF